MKGTNRKGKQTRTGQEKTRRGRAGQDGAGQGEAGKAAAVVHGNNMTNKTREEMAKGKV